MSEEQNLAQAAATAEDKVTRYTFLIPERLRQAGDPKKVTLRDLFFAEEKAAIVAGGGNGSLFGYEGAMRALYALDGRKVTWQNDEKQRAFESLSPKARDLVISGFLRFAIPTKEESSDFFKSVVIEPGA